jgi:hypothetical protein
VGKIVYRCAVAGCSYKRKVKCKRVHSTRDVPCFCPQHGGADDGRSEGCKGGAVTPLALASGKTTEVLVDSEFMLVWQQAGEPWCVQYLGHLEPRVAILVAGTYKRRFQAEDKPFEMRLDRVTTVMHDIGGITVN